jgi:chromosome segregation ATPase
MALPEGPATGVAESLAERVDSLATWVSDLETRLRVAEVATGDERTARELRKALEALSKHDPKLEKRVTDHVEVVTQRFDTLSSTVATTAAALAAREGEIAALRREVEEAERQLAELAGRSGGGADAKEVARLRGIVDALSAQRPARVSDSRVDELGANVRMLAERVDSLTATVSANAAVGGRRENELATIRERLDTGTQRIEALTAELRRLERDDSHAARIDALQVALVEANGAIADREQEAEQLRARIDEAYAHVGDVVGELQRAVGELAGQVSELQAVPRAAATALDARAAELDGKIGAAAERAEAVAAELETAISRIAQRDGQLAGLYRDVEAERARVDGLVAELQDRLDGMPDPASGHVEIEARLETLREGVLAVAARVESAEETQATHAEDETARATQLTDALAALTARLETLDAAREETAEQLRRADEIWLQERDWVRRQLERLAHAQEAAAQSTGGIGAGLDELRAQVDELKGLEVAAEARLEALASAVADAPDPGLHGRLEDLELRGSAVASALTALGERVDTVRAAASAEGAVRLELGEERMAELASRLERVEGRDGVVASESEARFEATNRLLAGLVERIARLEDTGVAAAADEGLAARVDEIAAKLARVESAAQSAAAAAAVAAAASPDEGFAEVRALLDRVVGRVAANEQSIASLAAPDEGLREIRALVDGVVGRMAATEQGLATVASGTEALLPALEELEARVESAERVTHAPAPAVDGAESGDGRFRLELRALELRMEHAEAAARENREAVLTQLERLASRMEWRLQRLEEAAQADSDAAQDQTGAEVVPIRGSADTT